MGTTSSSQYYSELNETIINAMTKQVQNCASNIDATQYINITGDNVNLSDINLKQAVVINMDCIASGDFKTSILNDIQTELTQKAEQNSSTLFGKQIAENYIELMDSLNATITNEAIQNCASSIITQQVINIAGSNVNLSTLTMDQAMESFSKCVQELISNSSVDNVVKHIAEQSTDQTAGQFDWIIYVVIGIVIIGVIFGLITMMSGRNTAESTEGPFSRFLSYFKPI